MMSWSPSGCACESSSLPFTIGKFAPSTCVMKYPCGRLVMTATCTPGLPSVVSAFVCSISLPAFAPERIWIAATLPPAAIGCEADIGCEVAIVDIPCEVAIGCDAEGGGGDGGCVTGAAGFSGCEVAIAGEGWEVDIVGTDCEVDAAAGAAAGFGAAPGRSTIVFSKSWAEAVLPAWSLMYFSLYLPSSITSFDCRKCFLIG